MVGKKNKKTSITVDPKREERGREERRKERRKKRKEEGEQTEQEEQDGNITRTEASHKLSNGILLDLKR